MTLQAQDGQPSRLQNAYAFLLDVETGIEITIMENTALRTSPLAYGRLKFRQLEAAARATFRGWEESVDSDKMLSDSFGLVLAHTHEFAQPASAVACA